MLDGGSSAAHASAFLDGLLAENRVRPSAVVYTHSHWDHVLGGAEVGGLVIAHALTGGSLVELAERDWSDDGLERRLAHAAGPPEVTHLFPAHSRHPRA
jgi:glyoxylase-like metal-dependent hydrolase (beta-lactamase superfamily II)